MVKEKPLLSTLSLEFCCLPIFLGFSNKILLAQTEVEFFLVWFDFSIKGLLENEMDLLTNFFSDQ